MSLVCLARFAQPPRVHLARLALERAGLTVEVRGEGRNVLVGELPDAGGELWVDERELERAQEVLRVAEQSDGDTGPERSCPSCAAPNPAGFESCWRCQVSLAGAEAVAPALGPAKEPARHLVAGSTLVIGALAVVVVVLAVMVVGLNRDLRRVSGQWPWEVRLLEGGCAGMYWPGGETLRALFCDRDGDGRAERTEYRDRAGQRIQVCFDADENGVFDSCDSFNRAGERVNTWKGTAAEGRFLESEELRGGVRFRYSDPDGDEVPERLDIDLGNGQTIVQWRGPRGWQSAP